MLNTLHFERQKERLSPGAWAIAFMLYGLTDSSLANTCCTPIAELPLP